jgi:hypothetical protein
MAPLEKSSSETFDGFPARHEGKVTVNRAAEAVKLEESDLELYKQLKQGNLPPPRRSLDGSSELARLKATVILRPQKEKSYAHFLADGMMNSPSISPRASSRRLIPHPQRMHSNSKKEMPSSSVTRSGGRLSWCWHDWRSDCMVAPSDDCTAGSRVTV